MAVRFQSVVVLVGSRREPPSSIEGLYVVLVKLPDSVSGILVTCLDCPDKRCWHFGGIPQVSEQPRFPSRVIELSNPPALLKPSVKLREKKVLEYIRKRCRVIDIDMSEYGVAPLKPSHRHEHAVNVVRVGSGTGFIPLFLGQVFRIVCYRIEVIAGFVSRPCESFVRCALTVGIVRMAVEVAEVNVHSIENASIGRRLYLSAVRFVRSAVCR